MKILKTRQMTEELKEVEYEILEDKERLSIYKNYKVCSWDTNDLIFTSSSVTGCKVTYYKDLLMSITIYKNNEHLGCFFSISNFTIENEE